MQNNRKVPSAGQNKQKRNMRPLPSLGKSGSSVPPLPPSGPRPKGKMRGPLLNKQASVASAYATRQSSSAPRLEATRDQCRIVHRELVASISGSAAFSIAQALALNPGLPATFPWLSTQASSWEQYRFNKLKFCYYTRAGSSIPGSVMMIPDYDPADGAPLSEMVASSYEDVEEDAPWKDIECVLRPQAMFPMGPKKFIRTGPLSANLDIKTYDAGTFFLGTVDGTNVNWGKLWVEYDITLFTPQTQPGGSQAQAAQHLTGTVPTTGAMLGATPVSSGSNLVSLAGNVLTFNQVGEYLLTYAVLAATATVTALPTISSSGSFVNSYGSNGNGQEIAGSGFSSLILNVLVKAVVGTTLTYNNTLANGTAADLTIAQVPNTLV